MDYSLWVTFLVTVTLFVARRHDAMERERRPQWTEPESPPPTAGHKCTPSCANRFGFVAAVTFAIEGWHCLWDADSFKGSMLL